MFKFTAAVGREKTLPIIAMNLIFQHDLESHINDKKFALFLGEVQKTYKREVQYHNDLHGADVANVANIFLTQGNLIEIAELDNKDVLSYLVAALCHDLGHDGYTNTYHSMTMSERAIRYNDVSVQENYHVAESFRIIRNEEFNFLDKLSKEEFSLFRKRMIGCILATDMAKHQADLSALKTIVESN